MSEESDEKICLFCLETKRGRRQHLPIEFRDLFVCKCIFQSHGECMMKWHIHCPEDLQCPICRVKLVVPRQEQLIMYEEVANTGLKKVLYYFTVYSFSVILVFIFFTLFKA